MLSPHIESILSTLPHLPGVYQFFDSQGNIIYVGKAKDLKKRVNSYFFKQHDSEKIKVLVSKIVSLKYVVVFNEADALLLENTLIKQYMPRYNICLKDDKSYPSICITNEPFPRVFATRTIQDDGAKYFGPYGSPSAVHSLMRLVHELYKVRTCKQPLSAATIAIRTIRPCLEYDIKNCLAPCIGKQTEEEYNASIKSVVELLKGHFKVVKEELSKQMFDAAQCYDFERANELKQNIALIEAFHTKSTVVNAEAGTMDVFFLKEDNNLYFCNFLRIESGVLVYSHTFEVSSLLEEETDVILASVITQIKQKLGTFAPVVLVPFVPRGTFDDIKFEVPLRGDKQKLLQLSERNCKAYIAQRQLQAEKKDPGVTIENHLTEMQHELLLRNPPNHIECFDNSNIQGTNPVASCVVFKQTKPSKKDYRLFNIKTVEGANDFASMQEIITRRYSRLVDENQPLPQLIVVDGGKGQLSAAYEALRNLNLADKIEIIGLAKRLEEVFSVNNATPLYLNKKGFTLKVLMQLRDEAHRFAITFHRNQRSKKMVEHPLVSIEGLGQKSVDALLKKYKTVAQIKRAGYEDVCANINVRVANILCAENFFI
jgi:excinuclease ABC subunit C